jgi:hypothetical protein
MESVSNDKELVKISKDLIYTNEYECCLCFNNEKCLVLKENCMIITYEQNDQLSSSPNFNKTVSDIEHIERTSTVSVNSVEKNWFMNNNIPDDIILAFSCDKHYICVSCLRKLISNFDNHQIDENNSNIYCPFPFEICKNAADCRNIIDHECVRKFCKSEETYQEYWNHAKKYRFPGFEIVNCPNEYYYHNQVVKCNCEILVSIEDIKNSSKGELIIECDQNIQCMKRFCYWCHQTMVLRLSCENCKLSFESEDPNAFNHYLNRPKIDEDDTTIMYKNKEITEGIVFEHIDSILNNLDIHITCPVCKIAMYKTEKCNEMTHHHIDRCYSCGRIGDRFKGLNEHWNTLGIGGCYRFNSDTYFYKYIPTYKCRENVCYDHDLGDCKEKEHQQGIQDYIKDRQRNLIYHLIKSLLPELRTNVLANLYEKYKDTSFYDLLPWAYTLNLIKDHKIRVCDCNEKIVYEELSLLDPLTLLGPDKSNLVPIVDSVTRSQHSTTCASEQLSSTTRYDTETSYWRRYLTPTHRQQIFSTLDNLIEQYINQDQQEPEPAHDTSSSDSEPELDSELEPEPEPEESEESERHIRSNKVYLNYTQLPDDNLESLWDTFSLNSDPDPEEESPPQIPLLSPLLPSETDSETDSDTDSETDSDHDFVTIQID